jgi:hypothetical protein
MTSRNLPFRLGFIYALVAACLVAGLASAATTPVIPSAATGSNTFYSPNATNGQVMLGYYNSGGAPTLTASGFVAPEFDSSGNLRVTSNGGPPSLGIAFTTTSYVSNAATAVTLVAASGSTVVYVYNCTVCNTDTTNHLVEILSSTGAKVIYPLQYLPANGALLLNINDSVQTVAGDALQFVSDSGASTKLSAFVTYVQR